MRSFASRSLIFNLTIINRVPAQNVPKMTFSHVLNRDVTGIHRIENRRTGGESTHDFA